MGSRGEVGGCANSLLSLLISLSASLALPPDLPLLKTNTVVAATTVVTTLDNLKRRRYKMAVQLLWRILQWFPFEMVTDFLNKCEFGDQIRSPISHFFCQKQQVFYLQV